ncbi:hypothetical protein [Candidatus Dormiibacter inghamiae]
MQRAGRVLVDERDGQLVDMALDGRGASPCVMQQQTPAANGF